MKDAKRGFVPSDEREFGDKTILKQKIYEYAEEVGIEVDVEIEDAVDYILKQKPLIASGDAIILDACDKWFNLVRCVIEENIGEYPYIDICPTGTITTIRPQRSTLPQRKRTPPQPSGTRIHSSSPDCQN